MSACGYCAGLRSACTCEDDCGARDGGGRPGYPSPHCPKAPGYLDWLREDGATEEEIAMAKAEGAR